MVNVKKDAEAPHGRDKDGKPLAPYGHLANGQIRKARRFKEDDFDLGVLDGIVDANDAVKAATAPERTRDRTPVQRKMDEIVRKAHAEWVKKGKPGVWKDCPVKVLRVSPESADAYVTRLRSSCTHEKLGLRIGSQKTDKATGKVIITFAVVDARKRESKPAEKSAK